MSSTGSSRRGNRLCSGSHSSIACDDPVSVGNELSDATRIARLLRSTSSQAQASYLAVITSLKQSLKPSKHDIDPFFFRQPKQFNPQSIAAATQVLTCTAAASILRSESEQFLEAQLSPQNDSNLGFLDFKRVWNPPSVLYRELRGHPHNEQQASIYCVFKMENLRQLSCGLILNEHIARELLEMQVQNSKMSSSISAAASLTRNEPALSVPRLLTPSAVSELYIALSTLLPLTNSFQANDAYWSHTPFVPFADAALFVVRPFVIQWPTDADEWLNFMFKYFEQYAANPNAASKLIHHCGINASTRSKVNAATPLSDVRAEQHQASPSMVVEQSSRFYLSPSRHEIRSVLSKVSQDQSPSYFSSVPTPLIDIIADYSDPGCTCGGVLNPDESLNDSDLAAAKLHVEADNGSGWNHQYNRHNETSAWGCEITCFPEHKLMCDEAIDDSNSTSEGSASSALSVPTVKPPIARETCDGWAENNFCICHQQLLRGCLWWQCGRGIHVNAQLIVRAAELDRARWGSMHMSEYRPGKRTDWARFFCTRKPLSGVHAPLPPLSPTVTDALTDAFPWFLVCAINADNELQYSPAPLFLASPLAKGSGDSLEEQLTNELTQTYTIATNNVWRSNAIISRYNCTVKFDKLAEFRLTSAVPSPLPSIQSIAIFVSIDRDTVYVSNFESASRASVLSETKIEFLHNLQVTTIMVWTM